MFASDPSKLCANGKNTLTLFQIKQLEGQQMAHWHHVQSSGILHKAAQSQGVLKDQVQPPISPDQQGVLHCDTPPWEPLPASVHSSKEQEFDVSVFLNTDDTTNADDNSYADARDQMNNVAHDPSTSTSNLSVSGSSSPISSNLSTSSLLISSLPSPTDVKDLSVVAALQDMPDPMKMKLQEMEIIEYFKQKARKSSFTYRQVKRSIAAICNYHSMVLQNDFQKNSIEIVLRKVKQIADTLADQSKRKYVHKTDLVAFLCCSPGCVQTVFLPCPNNFDEELSLRILRCIRITGHQVPLRCYECWTS